MGPSVTGQGFWRSFLEGACVGVDWAGMWTDREVACQPRAGHGSGRLAGSSPAQTRLLMSQNALQLLSELCE